MSIQRQIITALRERHIVTPYVNGAIIDSSTDNELIRMIFANYRGVDGQERGLAMTQGGLVLMRAYFQVYPVTFDPVPYYNAKQVLYLDRTLRLPWAIDYSGTLWSMDPEFAMRAKLVGDLDTLITAFANT